MKEYLLTNVLGVEAYVDKYIADNDILYFCSSFKNAMSVKGVQAGFLSNNSWVIDSAYYERSRTLNYKTHISQVSNNLYHGILYVEAYFNSYLQNKISVVYGDTKENIRTAMFKKLRQYSSIPLVSEWQDFILDNLLLDSAKKLTAFGFNYAYEITLPDDERVYSLVMDNIDYLKELLETEKWKL